MGWYTARDLHVKMLNAKIAGNIERTYEGNKPAILKRYDERDNCTDEVI